MELHDTWHIYEGLGFLVQNVRIADSASYLALGETRLNSSLDSRNKGSTLTQGKQK
jgi:hypothetical protein